MGLKHRIHPLAAAIALEQSPDLARRGAADGIEQFVVGAVIQDNGKVLLLKRPADDFMPGIWELPSGKVEADESLDGALKREFEEETGLSVQSIEDYLGDFDYSSGSGQERRQFNFAVAVTAPEPVKLTEHDTYAWTPVDDEPPVTDAVRAVLSKYRDSLTR